ncbi:MAG: CD225/dispanin family protein [Cellulomonas sp.]|nr:CD225/dispanin family protein [Cellulomonas sp.]
MLLFWPTGIPALLASHRAAQAFGAGDEAVAQREAASARRWGIVSVCVGAGLIVLSVLVSIAWLVLAAVAVQRFHDETPWDDGPGWTQRSGPAFPFDGPDRPDLHPRGGGQG